LAHYSCCLSWPLLHFFHTAYPLCTALKMDAARFSNKLVSIFQLTWRHNPGDENTCIELLCALTKFYIPCTYVYAQQYQKWGIIIS
jgi:hypothetical protein